MLFHELAELLPGLADGGSEGGLFDGAFNLLGEAEPRGIMGSEGDPLQGDPLDHCIFG